MSWLGPRATLAIVGALALTGCAAAQSVVAEAPAKPEAPAPSSPALWLVADEDSELWLFGTIHILDPEIVWRRPAIDAALAAADTVFLERANTPESDAEAQEIMAERGLARGGLRLRSRLSPAGRRRLPRVAARLRVQPRSLDAMEPWFAALWLSVRAASLSGAASDAGVDRLLERRARARGAALHFFETSAEQVAVFADMTEATQLRLLERTLEEIEAEPDVARDLTEAWRIGDIGAIEIDLMSDYAELPEALEAVIWRRNRAWAAELDRWMEGAGTGFVAVGAAHLVGGEGLPRLLEAEGREVLRR